MIVRRFIGQVSGPSEVVNLIHFVPTYQPRRTTVQEEKDALLRAIMSAGRPVG